MTEKFVPQNTFVESAMPDFGEDMKAFVKCPSCKHLVFTDQVMPLMTLLLGEEKYTCKECGAVLDFVTTSFCSRQLGDKCDECVYRFPCFSMRDATQKA